VDSSGLFLIGLGPGDLALMTRRAIDMLQDMDERYLEGYTATLPLTQENELENLVGPWKRVMRPQIENPREIIEMAKSLKVAIMVVGDPMQATTHVDLILRARENGVKVTIVPGISATTLAISSSGLQSYRFGRQVTLPYAYGDYLPTSPLRYILDNRLRNLHTLVLLDLDPTGLGIESPIHMSPSVARQILMQMAERWSGENEEVNVSAWNVVVLSDLGTAQGHVCSTIIEEMNGMESGRIHCLILPAEMDNHEQMVFDSMRYHA